jgi:Uncharacterized conserved protein (DUF2190)
MYKNNQLIKGFKVTAPIGANLAVKFGADDQTVVLASGASDLVIGFTTELGATAADATYGNLVDIVISGIAEANSGAAIIRGMRLTIDSIGQVGATYTGSGQSVCGTALASAIGLGEIIPVLLGSSWA